jgi:hypothetical protein
MVEFYRHWHVINLFKGIEFCPCIQIASMLSMPFTWSCFFYINIVHCTLSIPIISSTFIHVLQFHPCHLMTIMLSISSKGKGSTLWSNFIHAIKFIQMVVQNLDKFHMYNLISFNGYIILTSMSSIWEKMISCQLYPISTIYEMDYLFFSFSPWSMPMSFLGFFIHSRSGNHP